MTRKAIVVNVFTVDVDDIDRGPSGAPHLNANTDEYQFLIAIPTGDGWTLETWYPASSQHRQDVDLIPNLDHLATRIATALAVAEERHSDPGGTP